MAFVYSAAVIWYSVFQEKDMGLEHLRWYIEKFISVKKNFVDIQFYLLL